MTVVGHRRSALTRVRWPTTVTVQELASWQKEKPYAAKRKRLTAKRKRLTDKKNNLTAKRKTSRQDEKDSRKKEKPYCKKNHLTGKRNNLTAKTKRLTAKRKPHGKYNIISRQKGKDPRQNFFDAERTFNFYFSCYEVEVVGHRSFGYPAIVRYWCSSGHYIEQSSMQHVKWTCSFKKIFQRSTSTIILQ